LKPVTRTVPSPRTTGALAACLLVLGLGLFWPALRFEFLNYDDNLYVTENLAVQKGLCAESLRAAWVDRVAGNWHPVTMLSHRFDWQLFGSDAGKHHLVSVLLHAINGVLLFLVFVRATGRHWPACAAAALFLVHPLRIESVAWIAERKDLLCALFWMLATLAYLHFVRTRTVTAYLLMTCAFILGLLSKTMLVTFPFVLLLLDHWPLGRFALPSTGWPAGSFTRLRRTLGTLLIEKVPLLLVTAVFCWVAIMTQREGGAVRDLTTLPLGVRLETVAVAYVAYLGKIFRPLELAAFYRHPGAWESWQVAGCLALLLAISAGVLFVIRSRPWLATGWFWYLGTLVPVIGLVQIGDQWMADRYTYVPSIGIAVAVAWELAEARRSGKFRLPATAVLVAALTACVILTRLQLPPWRNSETLSAHAMKIGGGSWAMRTNHAIARASAGHLDEALAQFQSLVADYPDDVETLNNFGFALLQSGRPAAAVPVLARAVELRGSHTGARVNLAKASVAAGNVPAAIQQLDSVIARDADDPAAYFYLAAIYAGTAGPQFQDPARAVAMAARAVQLSPRPTPALLDMLGSAYLLDGKPDLAAKTFAAAIEAARREQNTAAEAAIQRKLETLGTRPK
jgi:Tfp pilus assembly protein PilF